MTIYYLFISLLLSTVFTYFDTDNSICRQVEAKMSCPFSDENLDQLKAFVELCKTQPQLLVHPKLSFFKDYLASLGVTIPTATFGTKNFTSNQR